MGFFLYANIGVAFLQVKFAKLDHSCHIFKDGADVRQGADIFDYDVINLPIVEEGLEWTIFLGFVEDRDAIGGGWDTDESSSQVFVNIFILKFCFGFGEAVEGTGDASRGVFY